MSTKKAAGAANKSLSSQHKDNYSGQLKQTEAAFFARPATMLMIARDTGIERAGICRYVAKLRKRNRIWLTSIGLCPITGHRAQFLCTDPNKGGIQ